MITKQKLLACPMPGKPKRLKPNAEYRAQLQRTTIDGTDVKIYTFHKIQEGDLVPYFRTFCWDNTFTTWVYDHGDAWSQSQGAVNRWSNAMVDKFINRYHLYRASSQDIYGGRGILCSDYGGFNGRVDGANIAEQLYKYQTKIRNDSLVEKQRRVRMDTEQIMAQLGEPPKDLPAFIDAVPLRASRYIYYKTTGKRTVKGKKMNVIAGYCTHCRRDFEQVLPVGSQLHNMQGKCPCCGTAVQYKSTGKVSKHLQDDARFAVIQRISHGIVIRGFSTRREYHNHYRNPKTEHREFFRIILTFSGHLQYFHWEFVPRPGTDRWSRQGSMQWRRYGRNGFVFPTNACLYTKNLRYALKGTPWEYSGIKEFARKAQEPVFIDDYLKSYEDHPCLEYLAKLGFANLIEDHLPGYGYSTMGNFQKTDFTRYDSDVVNLWGKNLGEVLPNTDKRDIPLLIKTNADVEMVRLVSVERKAGRAPTIDALKAANSVCHNWEAMRKLSQALPFAPLSKAVLYIQKQIEAIPEDKLYSRHTVISDWVDYLEMARDADWDMTSSQVLYPGDLKAAHDMAQSQYEVVKNAIHDAAIAAMAEEYRERYTFSFKGLVVVVPETATEIVQEGQALHHCVGRYVQSVAKQQTVILFIRRQDNPSKPYYTLEVSPNGDIQQCRGNRNCSPGKKSDVEKLLNAFKRSRLAIRVTTAAS